MNDRPRHYGWECSPYSAKTRSYLRYKGVPFDDVHPGLWTLRRKIIPAVGRLVMPTVELPDGTWLQDTSQIIDAFETQVTDRSVVPSTPRQLFLSYLVELFGDEWMTMVVMHTRWNDEENRTFIVDDFGREAAPWLPGPLRRRVGKTIGSKMASYLPKLGVTPETAGGIETLLETLLDSLDAHLAQLPYLLGHRPCIGDFSLMGMLYAHVLRDPGSSHWIQSRPHVNAWIHRVYSGEEAPGAWWPGDQIPDSLLPVLAPIFQETLPWVRTLVDAINTWCEEHPEATRIPRALGDAPFSVGGAQGERRLITFTQWMAQRPLFALRDMSLEDRESVLQWLEILGHRATVEDIHIRNPTKRKSVREVLDRTAP